MECSMLCSTFVFRAWPMPHAQEKCITGAKAGKVPKAAELTDLYWDGEPKERCLDHAARVALPYLW